MGGNKNDLSRALGEHDAELDAHNREITDLKARQLRAENDLRSALENYRTSSAALLAEATKTKWTRRGAMFAFSLMFVVCAWLIRNYPSIAEQVLHWLINQSSQKP